MNRYLIFLLLTVSQFGVASECVKFDVYVKEDIELSGTSPHPCGTVYQQCSIQIKETPQLVPTWAYELTSEGKIISKWPMPVDAQVYSVSGSDIFVAFPNYEGFNNGWLQPNFVKIGKNGSLNRVETLSKSSLGVVECSKYTNNPDIKQSFCYKFKDRESNNIRIIANEPVCS